MLQPQAFVDMSHSPVAVRDAALLFSPADAVGDATQFARSSFLQQLGLLLLIQQSSRTTRPAVAVSHQFGYSTLAVPVDPALQRAVVDA